ncbi:GNAT family N-acetyltransferase [Streptomyces rhizosphaericus]|uniref:GNAT family N-acetyltransferase n=1 Tax=Streptomyces rhizosphaericus TaxID=114699 RepID=UPI00142E615E|nr:GNAT family N-acetyltransferase [Streptomyces rhizosphaericus]
MPSPAAPNGLACLLASLPAATDTTPAGDRTRTERAIGCDPCGRPPPARPGRRADDRVRAHLGGPVTEDRVAARQAAYPTTADAFTVVRVADQRPIGLVTIGADHRCEGRAEISDQMLPAACGEGLGMEAVATAVSWWTDAVPGGGPLVAVTQKANRASCRMLEAIGMTVVDEPDGHGARQYLYTRAWVADIGDFLTRHLQDQYGLDPGTLRAWPSGLALTAADLAPPTGTEAERIVRALGIPAGRPVVAAVGRTKGLDVLIEELAPLHGTVHLAMIAVLTDDDRAALLDAYRERSAELGLSATIIGRYDRNIPRALAAWPDTIAMAVPSRGETLANVVFETALWAQHTGAIVLAPNIDGFPEQITDGHNGLLYDPAPGALTAGLRRAVALTSDERARLRAAAHRKVLNQRNAAEHLATLLATFWQPRATRVATLHGHPATDARTPRSKAPTSTHHPLEATP